MGEITSSYRDKLVSHFVEDKSSRGRYETGYHNIKTTRSGQKAYKFLVSYCDREHYPRDYDREDFSRAELRRHGLTTGSWKPSNFISLCAAGHAFDINW